MEFIKKLKHLLELIQELINVIEEEDIEESIIEAKYKMDELLNGGEYEIVIHHNISDMGWKIPAIKALREVFGLGLKEAKGIMDKAVAVERAKTTASYGIKLCDASPLEGLHLLASISKRKIKVSMNPIYLDNDADDDIDELSVISLKNW